MIRSQKKGGSHPTKGDHKKGSPQKGDNKKKLPCHNIPVGVSRQVTKQQQCKAFTIEARCRTLQLLLKLAVIKIFNTSPGHSNKLEAHSCRYHTTMHRNNFMRTAAETTHTYKLRAESNYFKNLKETGKNRDSIQLEAPKSDRYKQESIMWLMEDATGFAQKCTLARALALVPRIFQEVITLLLPEAYVCAEADPKGEWDQGFVHGQRIDRVAPDPTLPPNPLPPRVSKDVSSRRESRTDTRSVSVDRSRSNLLTRRKRRPRWTLALHLSQEPTCCTWVRSRSCMLLGKAVTAFKEGWWAPIGLEAQEEQDYGKGAAHATSLRVCLLD